MNMATFLGTRPCLEELDGYRKELIRREEWSHDDQKEYLLAVQRLLDGVDVPHSSRVPRAYTYVRGKKAKMNRRAHV